MGGNEKAAFISGIKVNKLKIMIYSLAGLMLFTLIPEIKAAFSLPPIA
jgi:ABC-type xylose transport system permease subunit